MVGQLTLDQHIGVRIPGGQPSTVSGGRKWVREMAQMCALCALGFLPQGKVASHSRKRASGWASVCEPGCARLPRRGRRAGIGRIRTVESAGAPLARRSGSGVGTQPLAASRVSGAGCVPGRGSRLGEQLLRSRFYLCNSREFGRGYAGLQGLYHGSPHLQLLIPGGKFPSRRSGSKAERGRQECFACMHRDVVQGCAPRGVDL
jgi:hypothetical protein